MKESKTVVLISLGQLLGTDLSKSVKAFAGILEQQNKRWLFGCLSPESSIKAALLLDAKYYGTIDKYKRGEIDFNKFHESLDSQIGIKTTTEQFKNAWNAMCTVGDKEIGDIKALHELQKQRGFELCVISSTNESQSNFIKQQLAANGIEIPVVTSFENHSLDLKQLAKIALRDKYTEGDKVISLHNAVSNIQQLDEKPGELILRQFDSRTENLVTALESIMPKKEIILGSDIKLKNEEAIEKPLIAEDGPMFRHRINQSKVKEKSFKLGH